MSDVPLILLGQTYRRCSRCGVWTNDPFMYGFGAAVLCEPCGVRDLLRS